MPFDNRRFALLAVVCYLAARSLSPSRGVGVRAAVIHRQPKAAQVNQFARHDVGKTADYDAGSLYDNQAPFSFPWSRRADAPSTQCNEVVSISAVGIMFRTWLTYRAESIVF
jgi:hypothetical protein